MTLDNTIPTEDMPDFCRSVKVGELYLNLSRISRMGEPHSIRADYLKVSRREVSVLICKKYTVNLLWSPRALFLGLETIITFSLRTRK